MPCDRYGPHTGARADPETPPAARYHSRETPAAGCRRSLKVGGQMRMMHSATRASKPLLVTAAPIPMAAMSSHTVVPEKLPKAVENGTMPRSTQAQHMMNTQTKSGITLVTQLMIAQMSNPIVHIAFCCSPSGAGMNAMARPAKIARTSNIIFFRVALEDVKISLLLWL